MVLERHLVGRLRRAALHPAGGEVHSDKARPTPPVFVEWHFLQRIVYEYCAAEYLRMGLANLKAFWNPMPGTDEHDDYQETRAKEQEEMKRFCEENPGYCA